MEAFKDSLVPLLEQAIAWLHSKSVAELFAIPAAAIFIPLISWFTIAWTTSPLRGIPGPFLAGWTNLWRLHAVWSDRYPQKMQQLHKKYGPVVRIGPNTVALDYPELIKTIYGTDGKFNKTEFYASSSAVVGGTTHYTLFGQPEHEPHASMKRPVTKYYTTGAALALEPQMDRAILDFFAQLDRRFASTSKPCDLWQWSLFLAWDLSSYLIFSRRFGYLERGCDFDSSIKLSATIGNYFQLVGQMPWVDFWLDKNPVVKIGPPTFTNLAKLSVDGYTARLTGKDEDFDPASPDYLQHFIDSKGLYPDVVNDGSVIAYTMTHIIAGADTTAIVVSSILYYLLSHPDVLSKLVAEVRGAGFDKEQPIPYSTARQLPYLDAVWLEVSRLQPIAGMRMSLPPLHSALSALSPFLSCLFFPPFLFPTKHPISILPPARNHSPLTPSASQPTSATPPPPASPSPTAPSSPPAPQSASTRTSPGATPPSSRPTLNPSVPSAGCASRARTPTHSTTAYASKGVWWTSTSERGRGSVWGRIWVLWRLTRLWQVW